MGGSSLIWLIEEWCQLLKRYAPPTSYGGPKLFLGSIGYVCRLSYFNWAIQFFNTPIHVTNLMVAKGPSSSSAWLVEIQLMNGWGSSRNELEPSRVLIRSSRAHEPKVHEPRKKKCRKKKRLELVGSAQLTSWASQARGYMGGSPIAVPRQIHMLCEKSINRMIINIEIKDLCYFYLLVNFHANSI